MDSIKEENDFVVSIHTPTQGVTLWLSLVIYCFSRFNPHTHAGCDIRATEYLQRWKVSIHTPTQGVTLLPLALGVTSLCFNPHTHAGCDLLLVMLLVHHFSFNPHTHAGCDSYTLLKLC